MFSQQQIKCFIVIVVRVATKETITDTGDSDLISVDSHEYMDKEEENTAVLKKPKSSENGFTTRWGPIGFKKKLHPLTIMVHNVV